MIYLLTCCALVENCPWGCYLDGPRLCGEGHHEDLLRRALLLRPPLAWYCSLGHGLLEAIAVWNLKGKTWTGVLVQ